MLDLVKAFAEHLRTLLEFHHGDDRAEQFVDPVKSWEEGPGEHEFVVETEGGARLLVTITELPDAKVSD